MENIEVNDQAQGAEVAEEQEVSSELQITVPKRVPDVILINGVETSRALITEQKEEVLAMKINGLEDEKGYNEAIEKRKLIKKTRTASEKWRKDFFAPFLSFKKEVDDRFKEDSADYKLMEEHLDKEIEPVEKAVEIARQKAEERKDQLAEERAGMLISVGGVFDGKGTYNFESLDGGLFILAGNLRTWSEEEFAVEYNQIKALWDAQQAEVQAQEALKNKEVEDLNSERTELRIEQLENRGYALGEHINDTYFKGDSEGITMDQIKTLNKDDWKSLLNPVAVATPEPVKEEPATVPTSSHNSPQPASSSPFSGIATGFSPDDLEKPSANSTTHEEANATPEVAEVAPTETQEPEVEEDSSGFKLELIFSNAQPYLEIPMGKTLKQRIFHESDKDLVLDGIPKEEIAMIGVIQESCLFALIKVK